VRQKEKKKQRKNLKDLLKLNKLSGRFAEVFRSHNSSCMMEKGNAKRRNFYGKNILIRLQTYNHVSILRTNHVLCMYMNH
jgi:hypothetical protein